jgi:hypothetical protein
MPGHPEFAAAFDAGLKGAPLPRGVTALAPAEAERRFAVYRNNVAVGLIDALAKRFPVIRRLVGDEFFAAMARHYSETQRPTSPVLLEWGNGFAAFLESFPPLADYPYMADVARIEYARGRAYHAADGTPALPDSFAGADPSRLRLHLHPSLQLLRLKHPAVSIWQMNQPGSTAQSLAHAGPETALVLRDPGFNVPVFSISPGDAAMIEQIMGGASLTVAAQLAIWTEPGFDPQPLILRLMQAGAILTPKEIAR